MGLVGLKGLSINKRAFIEWVAFCVQANILDGEKSMQYLLHVKDKNVRAEAGK